MSVSLGGAHSIIDLLAAAGTTAHTPNQSNVRVVRSVNFELYRKRNLIERFFNTLTHLRRIATVTTISPGIFWRPSRLPQSAPVSDIMSPRPRETPNNAGMCYGFVGGSQSAPWSPALVTV